MTVPDATQQPNAETRVDAAARALGHRFSDERLLLQACMHASRCGAQATPATKRRDANERMEFLGDALLGGALCLMLYRRYPDADEGPMSRVKSRLVSRTTLARASEDTGLLLHCLVGQQMSEPWPDSVKANLMESLLAAVFLDGGWEPLVTAVDKLLASRLEDPSASADDARMQLQVWCLEHHKKLPTYVSERSGGTDHEPEFRATVSIGEQSAEGCAGSRRRAETAAAVALMVLLTAGG